MLAATRRQYWLGGRRGQRGVHPSHRGASGFSEQQWRLIGQRRGRVDMAVEVEAEAMFVIIEIKRTNWDLIPADRVMRSLRRHLRQLPEYLDSAIEDMAAGRWTSIAGSLLYPARLARIKTSALIESLAGEQTIMVTWYEPADWCQ